jgi:squalene cyclase
MNVKDLIGTFTIVGSNQDAEGNSYKGTLTLAIDTNNRIIAKWLINEQEQIGTGFQRCYSCCKF